MAYSSNEDLLLEFSESELARLTGDLTGVEINEGRTDYARANADSIIDTYLFGRYKVPLEAPIDGIIRKISNDLTVFNLYEFAYRNSIVPSAVSWRRFNTLKLLKELQLGNIALVSAGLTASPPFMHSNKSGSIPLFNKSTMDDFWDF